jgi:hypothetical protein
MRAGKIGRWIGRSAVVFALGVGPLAAGAFTANMAESAGSSPAVTVLQYQSSTTGLVKPLETDWG